VQHQHIFSYPQGTSSIGNGKQKKSLHEYSNAGSFLMILLHISKKSSTFAAAKVLKNRSIIKI